MVAVHDSGGNVLSLFLRSVLVILLEVAENVVQDIVAIGLLGQEEGLSKLAPGSVLV